LKLRTLIPLLLAAAAAGGVAACGSSAPGQAARTPATAPPAPSVLRAAGPFYIGMTQTGMPASYAPAAAFASAIRHPVNLAMYYSGWYESFRTKFAEQAWKAGAMTLANMDPSGLAGIISGHSDVYLRHFAAQVKAFGHPVVISFGHEANGDWFGQTEPYAAVWPGASYAVTEVRALTSKPVLIAETSVLSGPHAASQVAGLFAGIRADGLIGLVWFNTDKNGFKDTADIHNWRLQDDPAALAAFRAAVKGWR